MHAPLAQTFPALQTVPQAPQCAGLLLVSTQLPEQLLKPLGQTRAQLPDTQLCPDAQAEPQAPQLAVLLVVSTHLPEQRARAVTCVPRVAANFNVWAAPLNAAVFV